MQIKAVTVTFKSPLLLLILISMAMANDDSTGGDGEAAVHIIYTEKPEDQEAEAFHIKTLASVLGSEDAAKDAILYSYKHAASGFSAKLTPAQVEEISRQPGVLQVVPDRILHLHSGPGKRNI